MTARLRQDFKRNQTRQDSPLRNSADEEAIIDLFREIREPEQVNDEKAVSRDAKKVGLEGCKTSTLEVKSKVCAHGTCWYHPSQSQKVDGPHVVILETLPEHAEREGLSVVHVSFAGVVSQDSVDHDLFFSFVEPAIFAAELGGSLCG